MAATKSALKKAIKRGDIAVDGVTANTATFVYGGETIRLSLPDPPVPSRTLTLALDVLYEDEYLAAIYKPAGIVVSGNAFRTVANALPQALADSALSDATRPQPVHRLDYATTGILLAGKTSSSIRMLNGMFEERQVHKTYYAVAIGSMPTAGTIDTPIDAKEAETDFNVLDTVRSDRFQRLNLVRLEPHSGRRHQLRRHLAGKGNPILGDKEYGIEPYILKGKGLYLHAHALVFQHPKTQITMRLQADLPSKFFKLFPALEPTSL